MKVLGSIPDTAKMKQNFESTPNWLCFDKEKEKDPKRRKMVAPPFPQAEVTGVGPSPSPPGILIPKLLSTR